MTESINDLGHGHDNLHSFVKSKEFKCKEYSDPTGSNYKAAKEFLSQYLTPTSFKTYWKLVFAFEPFILKTMTPITILSAAKMAGFDGNSINIQRIMSHNREYIDLTSETAIDVVDTINNVFVPY